MHLKLFEVPEASLKQYKSTRNGFNGYAYENEPESKYRLRDLEIKTEAEFEEEKTTKASTVDQSQDDFAFDNHRSSLKVMPMKQESTDFPIVKNPSDVDDMLLDGLDNLEDHFNDLNETMKAGNMDNRKRALTKDEIDDLRQTNCVARRGTI